MSTDGNESVYRELLEKDTYFFHGMIQNVKIYSIKQHLQLHTFHRFIAIEMF